MTPDCLRTQLIILNKIATHGDIQEQKNSDDDLLELRVPHTTHNTHTHFLNSIILGEYFNRFFIMGFCWRAACQCHFTSGIQQTDTPYNDN